jgi:hypothetical protein
MINAPKIRMMYFAVDPTMGKTRFSAVMSGVSA